ncbi:GmrSD restriction endonuclease domain-containing protein [Microbacterium caowuchunii]|uniref:DUF1524 domain-containing protein n=1 Tax=Microbacterium caowuchunii TaxID=2614638 RepID=A0A5N0TJV1_9MICO|nr:DUF1524 domain-containing protein [Microbacterium caowuchunii]KAA9134407.1 DUF1524 domain-containing protein [Microbacterium caowuchunii]
MSLPPAGWFPDPQNPNQTRYWDGTQWTAHYAPPAPPVSTLPPPAAPTTASFAKKIPVWLWAIIAIVGVLATVLLAPIVAIIALTVLITGIVALVKNTPTWLRFPSRKTAMILTIVAAVVFFITGSITSAMYPSNTDAAPSASTHSPTPSSTAQVTPTPTATPFADDAAALAAFSGQASTVADASVTTGQNAIAVLSTLEVKGRAPKTGYDRDEFGQRWLDIDRNGCDTRNDILARDLDAVKRQGSCKVTSGTLDDPFTGKAISFVWGQGTSELVQIDHVVALSDAWQKGGQQLTADQRATLANDPLNLLAVDGAANAQKGDGDAATWLPSNKNFRCEYVARQIAVKATYGLWVTQAEHDAMSNVLSICPEQLLPTSSFAAPAPEPEPVPEPQPVVEAPAPVEPQPAVPEPAPAPVEPAPAPPVTAYYENCDAVRAAGAAPLYNGQPGYTRKLDRDGDGVACE